MLEVENTAMKNEGRNPHPKRDDFLEKRIRGLISDQAYSTEMGRRMFADARRLQVDYFKDSLLHIDNPNLIHKSTQKLLHDLAITTNAHIVEGEEILKKLPKGRPIFTETNHYSGYKLTAIDQSELGVNYPEIDEIFPFPFFYAPMIPVADVLGNYLYDAHLVLPGELRKIQEGAGLLIVPEDDGSFNSIKRETEKMISRHPNSLIVIFPEGGTSGKRNMVGPYDMDHFHGGSLAIAEALGVPVIPVYQRFNPYSGFEIGILEPVDFSHAPKTEDLGVKKAYFAELAETTRAKMQQHLSQRKQSADVPSNS